MFLHDGQDVFVERDLGRGDRRNGQRAEKDHRPQDDSHKHLAEAETIVTYNYPAARASFMKPVALLTVLLAGAPAFAQAPDGAQIFAASGSNGQNGVADWRAPVLEALRSRAAEAIVEALMTGAMRPQGSRLSGPERRAVAEFVTGKRVGGDVTGADKGRCAS